VNAIDRYLVNLVDVVEGPKFTDDPRDRGGPTKYGITQRTLASHRGHTVSVGDVQALGRDEALAIYRADYVTLPGFDKVAKISEPVAIECIDTGVNMGPQVATVLLQRCLNVMNDRGTRWPSLKVDSSCGPATCSALAALLRERGAEGQRILLLALDCEQGARYISIAEADPKQQDFVFGWLRQRVQLAPDAAFYGVSA
jgi:lysozyme family protein